MEVDDAFGHLQYHDAAGVAGDAKLACQLQLAVMDVNLEDLVA
jgi:hypothetical protein